MVYAPYARNPISLNDAVLRASDVARGGIVLGRASSSLLARASAVPATVYQTKDDEALRVRVATSAAEGLLALLVGRTDQVLQDQRVLVLGYGAPVTWIRGVAGERAPRTAGELQYRFVRRADDDPRGTTGHMEKIAAQIPGSRLVIVPGGGHLVYLENAEPCNRHVLDFLAEHPGK